MAGMIDYKCPKCGSESVYWSASAHWDAFSQCWKLSDDIGEANCGDCGTADIEPVEIPYISEAGI